MEKFPVLSPQELKVFVEKAKHMQALKSLPAAKQKFGCFISLQIFLFPLLTAWCAMMVWQLVKLSHGIHLFVQSGVSIVFVSRIVFAYMSFKALTDLKDQTARVVNDDCEELSRLAGTCRVSAVVGVIVDIASFFVSAFSIVIFIITCWQYTQLKKYYDEQKF